MPAIRANAGVQHLPIDRSSADYGVFFGSVAVIICWHCGMPTGHERPQIPPLHGFPLGHLMPQPPQLLMSIDVFTHAEPHLA